ncbi:DNA alkylation repair protein [soil metagenome]
MNMVEVIGYLKLKADPICLTGMKRFGIENVNALGISIPVLRKLAHRIKTDHPLAIALWKTGIHEARILASMIDEPALVTRAQIDDWVKDFNSWDLCDQVCGNLFDKTPFAIEKAIEFSSSEQEFIKRAGFVLMAGYAVHNKNAPDATFTALLPLTEREAWDERNFVKKSVNWALRQIGKRNSTLRGYAFDTATRILAQNTKPARWIALNALKELKEKKQ